MREVRDCMNTTAFEFVALAAIRFSLYLHQGQQFGQFTGVVPVEKRRDSFGKKGPRIPSFTAA